MTRRKKTKMSELPRPLLPDGITMPMIPTLSIDMCRVPPLDCDALPLPFTDPTEAKPLTLADYVQCFCVGIVEGIRKVVQSIADFFNSPQVRRFFKHLAAAARKAGIIQARSMPVRRRAVSTKRAKIYRRKMQGDLRNAKP
jgi:hypothetical protein